MRKKQNTLKKTRRKTTTQYHTPKKKKLSAVLKYLLLFFVLLIALLIAGTFYLRAYYPTYYQKILNKLFYSKTNTLYENERIARIITLHSDKIFGIDLSHYQERDEIQWDSLYITDKRAKYPLQFAVFRATMGNQTTDKNFAHFWVEAQKHNLIRGAYHYYRPDEDPVKQANSYINNAPLEKGDLLPIIDVEQLPKEKSVVQFLKDIQTWLDLVEKHFQRKPILYTYINFYEEHLYSMFGDYPLWVANYNNVAIPTHVFKWQFWQFTENGITPGAKVKIDFNVFNGDKEKLKTFLIK